MLILSWAYVALQIRDIYNLSDPLAEKIFPATLTWLYAGSLLLGMEWGVDPANLQLTNVVYSIKEGRRLEGESVYGEILGFQCCTTIPKKSIG